MKNVKMKKKSRKVSKHSGLSEEQIDERIDEIRTLVRGVQKSDFLTCVKLADLANSIRKDQSQRLLGFYDEIGWSPSEAQKRIKIGTAFRQLDPGGHVAAFPISQLKILSRIHLTHQDLAARIIEGGVPPTVKQLEIVSDDPERFSRLEDTSKILKAVRAAGEERQKKADNKADKKDEKRTDVDQNEGENSSETIGDSADESKDVDPETSPRSSHKAIEKPSIKARLIQVRDELKVVRKDLLQKKLKDGLKAKIRVVVREISDLISELSL